MSAKEPKISEISDDTASEGEDPPCPSVEDDDANARWEKEDSPNTEMGDPSKEPAEEDLEKATTLKGEGFDTECDGNLSGAVEKYTEAVKINSQHPMLFTARAQCFLKLKKPLSCIQDCDRALELNPDSAKAFKLRGKAYRHLGEWEKAAKSINEGQKIDYDPDLWELQKMIDAKSKTLVDW
eukprot:189801_1